MCTELPGSWADLAMRALAIFLLSAWLAPASGDVQTREEKIAAAIPEAFSGQVVIGTPEEIWYSQSFGQADREQGIAVGTATHFDIGSITKPFTATAVLKLVAEGKLNVEQTLDEFFDGLGPPVAEITLHELLTHTSGLPPYSGEDEDPRSAESFDEWLGEVTLEFEPGSQYSYSNPGYSALARVIEMVSGQPYELYLNEHLAKPLGLGPIGYRSVAGGAAQAVGYSGEESIGRPETQGWLPDGPGWNLRANGGLLTNAETLMQWMQAVARGDVLPQEWAAKQLTRHVSEGEGGWYGYGWALVDRDYGEVVSHTGGNGYFFALAAWYRDHDLIIAITNNAFDVEQVRQMVGDLRIALGISDPQ